jgi:hypothetical protein
VERDGGHSGSGTNHEARLYRFSYSGGTYTLDGGFPVVMRTDIQSESLVIAKDSTDTLWATWTLEDDDVNEVYTKHTVGGDDKVWSAPQALPFPQAEVADDDISSIIAFTVGSENGSGCSEQQGARPTTSPGSLMAGRSTAGPARRRRRIADQPERRR